MLKLIVGGVMAASVLWGGAAAAAESPAKMALATQVSRQFIDLANFEEAVTAGLTSAEAGGMFALQPQWRGMLGEAFRQQVARDRELIVTLVARAMAPNFTDEELKAGTAILNDPAVQAGLRSGGKNAPEPSKATRKLLDSAAGGGFMTKFASAGKFLDPVQNQFVVAVMPGVFRSFGEQAEALEIKRRAAEGLPQSAAAQ